MYEGAWAWASDTCLICNRPDYTRQKKNLGLEPAYFVHLLKTATILGQLGVHLRQEGVQSRALEGEAVGPKAVDPIEPDRSQCANNRFDRFSRQCRHTSPVGE